jgi:Xaa-Pro aminopeptidase
MRKEYYTGNRKRVYEAMKPDSLAVFFSGEEIRKSGDEAYDFFGNRNFLYLTGIQEKNLILLAGKDGEGIVWEKLYLRRPDPLAERWTGSRIKAQEAQDISGIENFAFETDFQGDFHKLASRYRHLYTDAFKYQREDADGPAQHFVRETVAHYPQLRQEDSGSILRKLRTVKQPCEIAAIRKAEEITGEGIKAMMRASRPGMYEYQYKAEFEYVLGQYGTEGSGFPPIISAGQNNFCIHYYSYRGQAQEGDMILNDVGARWDGLVNDVSRGWPCGGKFSERQKLLYECALATSDHMFQILKPGFPMAQVDATIKRYNFERLKEAGVCSRFEDIGTYMWHGGAHHIGYDCHDVIETPDILEPGMVFCVDVGIYHEEWGIGFRVEDNCLITVGGCENLSAGIPRSVEEIEDYMGSNNLFLKK